MTYDKDSIEFLPKPTTYNFIDLEGQRFGCLIALGLLKPSKWLCQCDCGNTSLVQGGHLRTGHTKSCGCQKIKDFQERFTRHGHAKQNAISPEYQAYQHAKCRCIDPNDAGYADYGGRGIEFRFASFEEFYAELGDRPTSRHSVDRWPNNTTGHYEKGNVRWATRKQQVDNRRITHWLTFQNKTQTVADWGRELGIKLHTLNRRLRAGWSIEEALTTPLQKHRFWRTIS